MPCEVNPSEATQKIVSVSNNRGRHACGEARCGGSSGGSTDFSGCAKCVDVAVDAVVVKEEMVAVVAL